MANSATKKHVEYLLSMYRKHNELVSYEHIAKDTETILASHTEDKIFSSYLFNDEMKRGFLTSSPETKALMYEIFQTFFRISDQTRAKMLLENMDNIIAMYYWGKTKVVYDFNKEISDSVMESMGDDIEGVTLACLEFLPVNAFYMKLPSIPISDKLKQYLKTAKLWPADTELGIFGRMNDNTTIEGFLCYRDVSSGRFGYMVEWGGKDTKPYFSTGFFSDLFMRTPISDWASTHAQNDVRDSIYIMETARVLVPHLLYLTAENAEVPAPRKMSLAATMKEPSLKNVQQLEVGKGYRIRRRKFRQQYASSKVSGGSGSMKAPHVRRAHYSHYWYGKKDSPDRQIRLKWIPETYIHKEQMLDVKPTIVNMT